MKTIDIAAILSPDLKSLLLKDPKASPCKVTITNVPEDLKAMLDAVSRTQVQAKVIPSNTPEVDFKTVDEMVEFLSVARWENRQRTIVGLFEDKRTCKLSKKIMTQLSDKEREAQMEDMKSFDKQMPSVGST